MKTTMTTTTPSVRDIYDASRIEDGTHGNLQAWVDDHYRAGGLAAVQAAISDWLHVFVGSDGVYVGVSQWTAVRIATLTLTAQELESMS